MLLTVKSIPSSVPVWPSERSSGGCGGVVGVVDVVGGGEVGVDSVEGGVVSVVVSNIASLVLGRRSAEPLELTSTAITMADSTPTIPKIASACWGWRWGSHDGPR
jgi:hypothetical protein